MFLSFVVSAFYAVPSPVAYVLAGMLARDGCEGSMGKGAASFWSPLEISWLVLSFSDE